MATPRSDALQLLGVRVREHRQALGLSQEALGDVSGLHWTFIGQVERGQRNISLHNLLRLAQALEVDAGVLVTGLVPPAG
jgi:transcriptional regulator with XRE-family HTH domain